MQLVRVKVDETQGSQIFLRLIQNEHDLLKLENELKNRANQPLIAPYYFNRCSYSIVPISPDEAEIDELRALSRKDFALLYCGDKKKQESL